MSFAALRRAQLPRHLNLIPPFRRRRHHRRLQRQVHHHTNDINLAMARNHEIFSFVIPNGYPFRKVQVQTSMGPNMSTAVKSAESTFRKTYRESCHQVIVIPLGVLLFDRWGLEV